LEDFKPNSEIAALLNEGGYISGRNRLFTHSMVASIISNNGLKSLSQRFRDMGFVSQDDIMKATGLNRKQLLRLRKNGAIHTYHKADSTYFYRLDEFSAYMAK